MLRDVLRMVVERGTSSSEELARALDTSPELVRLALEELVRRDYLQAVVPGCSAACERCPLHAACLHHRQLRVWMLTHKGKSWAA
jgi:predicted ArsR family transcriptional regulator